MASVTGPTQPPPAPPPPPAPISTPKVLANGKRPPENSKHVVSVRSTKSEERSPFANIHPETLQHAAKCLRKTQYREPLLSCETDQAIRRSNQLADWRHWQNLEINAPLEQHPAGEPIHASEPSAAQSVPIRVNDGYTNPLNSTTANHIYQQPLVNNFAPFSTNIKSNNNNNSSYSYTSSSSTNPGNANTNGPASSYVYSSYSSPAAPASNNNISSTTSSYYSTVLNNNNNNTMPSSHANSQQQSVNSVIQPQNPVQNSNGLNTTMPQHNYFESDIITDPQSRIHHYSVNTPASSIYFETRPGSATSTTTTTKTSSYNLDGQQQQPHQQTSYSSNTTSRNNDFRGNSLARELRDSGLTDRQKYSNQFQKPYVHQRNGPDVLQNLYQETHKYTSSVDDPVNSLIKDMEWKMRTNNYGGAVAATPGGGGTSSSSTSRTTTTKTTNIVSSSSTAQNRDFCAKCGAQIVGDTPGVTALGNAYHVTCFACDVCQKQLAGCSFYSVDGKNLCQVDYMNSLEKCDKCMTPITQKILRAMGKPFHPECFACPACSKSLDGIPFTVDKENLAYCLDCYHERFSPRCAVCLKAIAPSGNETEVARVIAMDRSYHIECYRCEDCGMKLNSKVEGQGCYPLENHLFCKNCNLKRLKESR